jgi:hypothetical protein
MQIVGAFAVASRAVEPSIGFGLMLAGNLAWVGASVRMREWSVLTCNAAFAVSNIIGLLQWVAS